MMTEQNTQSADGVNWGLETEDESYRTFCVPAFVGFGLGVLSLLAFAYLLALLLPVAAALISVFALRQIAVEPDRLIGRRVALVGLAISILIGIGVPTQLLTHRWVVVRQTQSYASQWFTHLRDGHPHMALEMTREIRKRRPLDDQLWQTYRNSSSDAEALRKYVRDPVVAALLALGDSATARFYETKEVTRVGEIGNSVEHVFAVTYQDEGSPRTFFVNMSLGRDFEPYKGATSLRVYGANGGVTPKQWQEAQP
jgi:hypothetical protein